MSILPILTALQANYTIRKNSKVNYCRYSCKFSKGLGEKCKKGYYPELEWKYCPHNEG